MVLSSERRCFMRADSPAPPLPPLRASTDSMPMSCIGGVPMTVVAWRHRRFLRTCPVRRASWLWAFCPNPTQQLSRHRCLTFALTFNVKMYLSGAYRGYAISQSKHLGIEQGLG